MNANEIKRKIWFMYNYNKEQLESAEHRYGVDHYESVLMGIISIMEFIEMIDMKKYEKMTAEIHRKARQREKEIKN